METPIPIFNNTHIELTHIVTIRGELFMNKIYLYVSDIKSIEASRYGIDFQRCTKIWFDDSTFIKVTEKYKAIRDTHIIYQKWLREQIEAISYNPKTNPNET